MSCRRPSNASSSVTGPSARSARGRRPPRPSAGAVGPRRSRRLPGCAPSPERAACPVLPGTLPGRRPRAGSRWWLGAGPPRFVGLSPSWLSPFSGRDARAGRRAGRPSRGPARPGTAGPPASAPAQPVAHPAPLPRFRGDQTGLGEQRQVLGDGLPGYRQPVGQVGGGRRAADGERREDGAPGRVGERAEDLLGDGLAPSGGVEVVDQLASSLRPALDVAAEGLVWPSSGICAKPDSTTVSWVPAPTGSRVNST